MTKGHVRLANRRLFMENRHCLSVCAKKIGHMILIMHGFKINLC